MGMDSRQVIRPPSEVLDLRPEPTELAPVEAPKAEWQRNHSQRSFLAMAPDWKSAPLLPAAFALAEAPKAVKPAEWRRPQSQRVVSNRSRLRLMGQPVIGSLGA